MIYNLKAGDLATVKQAGDWPAWGSTIHAVTARLPGLKAWDLWIPRGSIMTIIKITTPSVKGLQTIATVLHDGQILEVFLSDIEIMDSVTQ